MASQSGLNPPVPFLPRPGEPLIKWSDWKDYFLNYVAVLEEENEDEFSQSRKKKMLLHSLGPEGNRVFNQMEKKVRPPDSGNVFLDALEDLDAHYHPPVCVGISRYEFFQRKQGKMEPAEDYVAALKKLAINCEFGTLHDSFIRDQLVMHSNNSAIQEKLWTCGDAPLNEIFAIVRKAEMSKRCAKVALKSNEDNPTVSKVSSSHVKSKEKRPFVNSGIKSNSVSKGKVERMPNCYRCGYNGHYANDAKCPAVKSKCSYCGKVGHFTKACRKRMYKSKNTIACVENNNTDDNTYSNSSSDEGILCIVDSMESHECVYNVNGKSSKKPTCDIKIGGVQIHIVPDSGSPYTIIQQEVWNELFASTLNKELQPPDIQPVTFTGEKIPMLGFINEVFEFKGRKALGKLYVAQVGPSVLGWVDQGALGIILNPKSEDQVMILDVNDKQFMDNVVERFPTVFSGGVGKLVGFSHKIVLKDDACPVSHKARNVPISIREGVMTELDDLEKKGLLRL